MAQAKQQATGDSAVVHMAHAGGLGPQPTYAAPKPVGGGAPRRLEQAELVAHGFVNVDAVEVEPAPAPGPGPAPAPAPAPAPEKAVAPGGAAAQLQAEIAELLQAQDEMKSQAMRELVHQEIELKQRELAELTRAAKSQAPGMQMPPDVTFQAFGNIKEVFDFFANTAEEHRGFCPMLDADTESTITAMKLSRSMVISGFNNLATESLPIDAEFDKFKSIIKQWDKTGSGYIGMYTPHPTPTHPPLQRTMSLATTTEQPNNTRSHLSVDHGVVLLTVLYRRPREQSSRSSSPRYVLDPYYIC
eukprot:COSAG02_NODE_2084_length_9892_cov_47.719085_5_plen_302_part_00